LLGLLTFALISLAVFARSSDFFSATGSTTFVGTSVLVSTLTGSETLVCGSEVSTVSVDIPKRFLKNFKKLIKFTFFCIYTVFFLPSIKNLKKT